jgi:hypothetical protein
MTQGPRHADPNASPEATFELRAQDVASEFS